jgi:hypothetical protein
LVEVDVHERASPVVLDEHEELAFRRRVRDEIGSID